MPGAACRSCTRSCRRTCCKPPPRLKPPYKARTARACHQGTHGCPAASRTCQPAHKQRLVDLRALPRRRGQRAPQPPGAAPAPAHKAVKACATAERGGTGPRPAVIAGNMKAQAARCNRKLHRAPWRGRCWRPGGLPTPAQPASTPRRAQRGVQGRYARQRGLTALSGSPPTLDRHQGRQAAAGGPHECRLQRACALRWGRQAAAAGAGWVVGRRGPRRGGSGCVPCSAGPRSGPGSGLPACLHRLGLFPAAAGLQLHLAQLPQREQPEGAPVAHRSAQEGCTVGWGGRDGRWDAHACGSPSRHTGTVSECAFQRGQPGGCLGAREPAGPA